MKNKFWIIALLAISFSGCYTSFIPRDYELESYKNYEDENYYADEIVADNDSLEYYENNFAGEEQGITIINNYPVYISTRFNYYDFYDPFYDPYWEQYYYPYYSPYYGGNIYVYGDAYWGSSYGGNWYYPSQTRYRNERSHWTNLRNNGGRISTNRVRDKEINDEERNRTRVDESGNFKLDSDLRVTRKTGSIVNSSGSGNTGISTSTIRKNGEVRTATRKTTDLERRRVSDKIIKKDSNRKIKEAQNINKQKITKKSNIIYKTKEKSSSTQSRSKRVYSSSENSGSSNSKSVSRSFYKPTNKSDNTNSTVRSTKPNSNRSSKSSSKSGSSRSNISKPSNSAPRSAVSSPSSSTSSRSSSSSSSSSNSRNSDSSRGRR